MKSGHSAAEREGRDGWLKLSRRVWRAKEGAKRESEGGDRVAMAKSGWMMAGLRFLCRCRSLLILLCSLWIRIKMSAISPGFWRGFGGID